MSLALGRLRKYFGDELLHVVGKTMVLTPLATQLVGPLRDVLLQVQTITRARPTFDAATTDRRFTIEASDYVIAVLLAEVVRQASRRAPSMQFDVRALSPQSPEHLNSGECELLIAPEFASVHGHPSDTLFEDTFSCLVSSDHPARGHRLGADAYFDAGHIGVEWGGGRRVTFDTRLLATAKRERRQDVIAPSFTLVPELLSGTKRIATLPTKLAHMMAKRFPLRVMRCPLDIPPFIERLHWHKYQERDPAIVWLRSLLHEVAEGLQAPERAARRGARAPVRPRA